MNGAIHRFQLGVENTLQSPFETLPAEILIQVFGFLSVVDAARVSLVCKRFHHISSDERLWKHLCLANAPWKEDTFSVLLEDAMKECIHLDPEKNWRWVAKCISSSPEKTKGLSWNVRNDVLRIGEFTNSELDGWGVYLLLTGSKYVGGFAEGAMQGSGIFMWTDGRKYEGVHF